MGRKSYLKTAQRYEQRRARKTKRKLTESSSKAAQIARKLQ